MFEAVVELLGRREPTADLPIEGRSDFDQRERAKLAEVLAEHRWNVSAAARALGMTRGKLRGRMRALDLE